jgi:hypothetical protein
MLIITFSENIKVIKQCAVRIEEMHPGYPSSPDRVRFAQNQKKTHPSHLCSPFASFLLMLCCSRTFSPCSFFVPVHFVSLLLVVHVVMICIHPLVSLNNFLYLRLLLSRSALGLSDEGRIRVGHSPSPRFIPTPGSCLHPQLCW